MAGFRLSKTQTSGFAGQLKTYAALAADSSQMAIGDAVIGSGTATAQGVPSVARANGGTGTEITGVIAGFAPDPTNLSLQGRTASTLREMKLQIDPMAEYELEIGSVLAITDVGANFLLTANAPTASGNLVVSAMVSGAADASGPLRLIRLVEPTDGTAIGAVGNTGVFTIIRSQLTNLTGV